MLVNQRAGRYAASLARWANLRVFAVVLFDTGLILRAYEERPYATHRPLLISIAAILLVSVVVVRAARHHAVRAAVGSRSEKRVADVLESLAPVALLNSVLLGAGGDADHILLGPWLAVIETKTGHGSTRYDGHTITAGHRVIPGNPVAQVQRQARALAGLVGTGVDSVVCVVDMTNPPYRAESSVVCSLADLPHVLSGLSVRIDSVRARRLYERLARIL